MAILSLHHVEDLGMAVSNMADLLRAGGTLVVVEFAWDRIDEATAEWALERLPVASRQRSIRGWDAAARSGRVGAERNTGSRGVVLRRVGQRGGFHSSLLIRDELGRRFVERFFEWVPYLYPDLREDVSESDESAAIRGGNHQSTGFRYVGTRLA